MKFSFVFGFTLLILLIIAIFVGLPYVSNIVKSGSLTSPFSFPFSFPKITTQSTYNYFLSPKQTGSGQVQQFPGESSYKGKVNIGSVYFSNFGQISLRSSYFSNQSVDITGFKIKSAKKGETIIGKAMSIPQFDSASSDIQLSSGNPVDIIVGSSPLGNNFRINNCFGWLSGIYNLSYSLDYCPGNVNIQQLSDLDSSCVDLILRTNSCRMPNEDTLNGQSGKCRNWVEKNMNYSACIANHKNDSNFYKAWEMYTGNNNRIFDPLHDKIERRDKNGLLIDSYEY